MTDPPIRIPFLDPDGIIAQEWADWLALEGSSSLSPSTFGTQIANTVLSGPTSGSAASPTFRALVVADIPSGLAATKISTGIVSNTEFDFLDGVTSNIQTQLNATASPAQVLARVMLRN